jgi:rod shape determining protein RodA
MIKGGKAMFGNFNFINTIKFNAYKIDKQLLMISYLLTLISTIFVYSATRSIKYIILNVMWIVVGTITMMIITFFDYKKLKNYLWQLYGIGIILMLLVRIVGKKTLGAQRWIKLGPITIQPSEFVKIIIIIILAYWITSRFKRGIRSLKDLMMAFLPAIPLLILILAQPDLGTTLIVTFSFGCMVFLYKTNPVLIAGIMITILLIFGTYPLYRPLLSDYQQKRVETFLNPEQDKQGGGWQVTQSKISVGAGGFIGSGIFKGSQSRLEFLPEAQTDFIFSIISEETGFLGSSIVLGLYFWLIYSLIKISKKIDDDFGKLLLYGIAGIFLFHVLINVGMTLGLAPVTGKPLLFLSYGGSSFLSSFMLIGLAESVKVNSD